MNLPHKKEIPQVPKGSAPVLVKRMLGCAALEVAIRPGSIGSDWAKQKLRLNKLTCFQHTVAWMVQGLVRTVRSSFSSGTQSATDVTFQTTVTFVNNISHSEKLERASKRFLDGPSISARNRVSREVQASDKSGGARRLNSRPNSDSNRRPRPRPRSSARLSRTQSGLNSKQNQRSSIKVSRNFLFK